MQPSDGMILVIGPRLEGHSVIFLAMSMAEQKGTTVAV